MKESGELYKNQHQIISTIILASWLELYSEPIWILISAMLLSIVCLRLFGYSKLGLDNALLKY